MRAWAILLGVTDSQRDSEELAALEGAGERRDEVLGRLFEQHRARLRKMVHLRMDPKLRARIDASDVLQETYVEVSARLGDYLDDPRMPFFVWLRFLTAQKLVAFYRHHVATQKRDVRRQVPIERKAFPAASSAVMAEQLIGRLDSPSGAAMQAEARRQVEEALEAMNPNDREVLVMRHFEQLSNLETAHELGLDTSAASKRYLRALQRLRGVLEEAGLGDGQA